MDEQERQELNLEEIMKEFGGEKETPEFEEENGEVLSPEEQAEEEEVLNEEPVRQTEPVRTHEEEMSADTIRLDGLREELANRVQNEVSNAEPVEEPVNLEDTICSEPFTEKWEPEYEQPIGEYVPPQPIQFRPRSRLRELKRKLVAGPERRYYELSEIGIGKLQAAVFLSFLVALIAAASTVMYALGMVQENRLRLMVFGQMLAMMVSALLGSFQLIEGLADLGKKRFSLNTLLVVTFLFCCADGILGLKQLRVPCCAAFTLEMTMSLWSTCHRRRIELAQMDTMRKATHLDGVGVCEDYLDGQKGFLPMEGQVEDFMDSYAAPGKAEKRLNIYALIAMLLGLAVGSAAGVLKSMESGIMECVSMGIQVTAVTLLIAVPATAHISQSRPEWLLERRLHRLGTVLCGWRGIQGLCGKAVFPIGYSDLFPVDAVRMNGMKFFSSREPDQVMAYATAVIAASECGLTGLFTHVLDSHNGRHYDASELCYYDNGGMSGVVEEEAVLIGSASFLKEMGVEVPESARINYGVYVAIGGELSGLFAVTYERTKSAAAGLSTLTSYRKLRCMLTGNDFMLTEGFLKSKFSFRAKRILMPDYEVRAQLREKALEPDTQALLLTTSRGLAPLAYGVTGARTLKTTCSLGAAIHIFGGVVGIAMMAVLVAMGALELLTPVNVFLYQLVWIVPGLLITEWTRSI